MTCQKAFRPSTNYTTYSTAIIRVLYGLTRFDKKASPDQTCQARFFLNIRTLIRISKTKLENLQVLFGIRPFGNQTFGHLVGSRFWNSACLCRAPTIVHSFSSFWNSAIRNYENQSEFEFGLLGDSPETTPSSFILLGFNLF